MCSVGFAALCSASVGCQYMATGYNLQGKKQYQKGDFAGAMQNFQKASQTNPRDADALYNMAAVFQNTGKQTGNAQDFEQAALLYQQCLEIDPNHEEAYRGYAVLMVERGQDTEAFELLRGWVARSPNSPEPRIELARLYKEFGDKETATELLTTALSIDHQNARTLRALGQLREEEGDYQAAIANYQRAYQLNTLQPDLAARIASLQQNSGVNYSTGDGTTRMVNQPATAPRY